MQSMALEAIYEPVMKFVIAHICRTPHKCRAVICRSWGPLGMRFAMGELFPRPRRFQQIPVHIPEQEILNRSNGIDWRGNYPMRGNFLL